ncbi:X-linked interleukin-1 receptor accessory protein-like 2 [Ciona intestinalis]
MYTYICVALLTVWLNSVTAVNVKNQVDFKSPSCTLIEGKGNETRVVYRGWPYSVNCENFEIEVDLEDEDFTCIIWDMDRNVVLQNRTGEYYTTLETSYGNPDTQDSSPLNLFLQAKIPGTDICYYSEIHIIIAESPKETCDDSSKIETSSMTKISVGQHQIFSCEVPDTFKSPLAPIANTMQAMWFRNCLAVPQNATILNGTKNSVNKLSIPNFSYDDAGVYTCLVTYHGLQRYVARYRICARPAIFPNTIPSIHCTHSRISVILGQNVTVECQVNLGKGRRTSSTTLTMRWTQTNYMQDNTTCVNAVKGTHYSIDTPKVSCSYNLEETCYYHVATAAERQLDPEIITLRLHIPNVQRSDLGTYTISVETTSVNFGHSNASVVITEKSVNNLPLVISLAVGLSVLLKVIIVVILLACCFPVYTRAFWKKHFKSYTTEKHDFGAYLSYQFSTEMDIFSQQQSRDALAATCDALETLGYRLFDENRDGQNNGYIAENSMQSMAKCHRVVIILTSEYIKDNWSVFRLQQSFMKMIDSGRKVIFILVPGIQEFIKQKGSEGDACCKMVCRALKLNHAIQWSDDKKFKLHKFKLQLDVAMPKINPHSTNFPIPMDENSNGKANGYHRGISTETDVTELNAPGTADSQV